MTGAASQPDLFAATRMPCGASYVTTPVIAPSPADAAQHEADETLNDRFSA